MRRTFCLGLIFFVCFQEVNAQQSSDREKVERAMLDYLEGFYEGDTLKIKRGVAPYAVKYGYYKDNKSGLYNGEAMPFQEMIAYSASVKAKNRQAKPGTIKEVLIYEVQEKTASGKVTAWWGTDYILLEKLNDGWLVRMVLWEGPLKRN